MASLVLRKNRWYIAYRLDGQPLRMSTGCAKSDRIGAEIKWREFTMVGKASAKQSSPLSLTEVVKHFHCYQITRGITLKQAAGNQMRITRLCNLAKVDAIDPLTEASVEMALATIRKATTSKKCDAPVQPLLSPRSRNT